MIKDFSALTIDDIETAGGKNASLGEMIANLSSKGINVPKGFAVLSSAYHMFLDDNHIKEKLQKELDQLDKESLSNLSEIGTACRKLIAEGKMPPSMKVAIVDAYRELSDGKHISVAVRSSATAEDLPSASFAGQHDSFLNITDEAQLLQAVKKCYISLFNDRAIKYRIDNGFEHMQVGLSVGIQQMIRADKAAAGVAFTLDPETGFKNIIYLTSAWGLGENIVQGAVNPDEFYIFKPALKLNKQAIIKHRLGAKENKMIYENTGERPIKNVSTSAIERNSFSINDDEVLRLSKWCLLIEQHYGVPMDIEWAKDGDSGELYIIQARPETVHTAVQKTIIKEYKLKSKAAPICTGKAVGHAIVTGKVCIVKSMADAGKVMQGDILVADITNPDWNAMMRKAVSIITNKGGRTSHASIVARELGIHAVVGTGNATDKLYDGQVITVSCIEGDEGKVYDGKLDWQEKIVTINDLPAVKTKPMFILADPDKAFRLSFLPNEGVGLLRMEFIIANTIRIHPMALVQSDKLSDSNDRRAIEAITMHYADKKKYFVENLAESVAIVAAAFYPKEVIVRMSDFKTNEYAQLIGGKMFEPLEENPMLGFRGASRYYNEQYRDGFGLECEAMRVARDEMGFTNIKLMIPFCRTIEEGKRVLETMKFYGLERGKNNLEVYVMAEIPSNVILAEKFAALFDGFSIGSNDLTQLTLGIDRDSAIISNLFDENNEAVKVMLSSVIRAAKEAGVKIGLCGQAPSDYPQFAQFLVEQGIDSISFTPDALIKGIQNIAAAEMKQAMQHDFTV
jgi:pyruvate,water dikinase